jgi:hypothetical protein
MPYRDDNNQLQKFLEEQFNNIRSNMETDINEQLEKAKLEKENRKLKTENSNLQKEINWEKLWHSFAVFTVVICIVSPILYATFKWFTCSEQPTVCVVTQNYRKIKTTVPTSKSYTIKEEPNGFRLQGIVYWGSDLNLGNFTTIEEALEAANLLKCNIDFSIPN